MYMLQGNLIYAMTYLIYFEANSTARSAAVVVRGLGAAQSDPTPG